MNYLKVQQINILFIWSIEMDVIIHVRKKLMLSVKEFSEIVLGGIIDFFYFFIFEP